MNQKRDKTDVVIRPARDDDLERITDIRLASFSNADSFVTKLGREATYRYMSWMYKNSSDFYFICAEVKGEVAGYGILAKAKYRNIRHFVRENFLFLIISILRRPSLLLTTSLTTRVASLIKYRKPRTKNQVRKVQFKENKDHVDKRNACVLLDTAVHPDFQRMGIGTKILIGREKLARVKGFNTITCTVHRSNIPSIEMHEKHGYIVIPRDDGAVRMEKILT